MPPGRLRGVVTVFAVSILFLVFDRLVHGAELSKQLSAGSGAEPEGRFRCGSPNSLLLDGGRFSLAANDESGWELRARALTGVADAAKDGAVTAIELDRPFIVDSLARLEPIDCEDLSEFLRAADKVGRQSWPSSRR
jgi:hypothetical protein